MRKKTFQHELAGNPRSATELTFNNNNHKNYLGKTIKLGPDFLFKQSNARQTQESHMHTSDYNAANGTSYARCY